MVALGASATSAFSLSDYGNDALNFVKRSMPLSVRSGGSSGSGSNSGPGSGCPPVWTSIAKDLTAMFLDTSIGQCNDDARAAIREAFHDCGAWETAIGPTGGCDGSLILSTGNDELLRGENNGLQDISAKLLTLQQKWVKVDSSVSVADIIQFAGAVAIVTCPGGPQVQTFVGRKDSTVPAAHNLLPDVHAPAADLFALFQRKGFSARELAALLGAHSTSKQFHVDVSKAGEAQDSTPGIWDVQYYSDTLNPPQNVFVFPSDDVLSKNVDVGPEFLGFVDNQGKWTGSFAKAMTKLSLLGVPNPSNLKDCTSAVPRGTGNKRDMRAAPINDRIR